MPEPARHDQNFKNLILDYLCFDYLACVLDELPAERFSDSGNIVARLNLPNMRWPRDKKIEVYAQAIRGLLTLEPELEKRLKYMDFVDIYSALDDNERWLYAARYPQENRKMAGLTERLLTQGRQQGMQLGRQEGELVVLTLACPPFRPAGTGRQRTLAKGHDRRP